METEQEMSRREKTRANKEIVKWRTVELNAPFQKVSAIREHRRIQLSIFRCAGYTLCNLIPKQVEARQLEYEGLQFSTTRELT